MLEAEAPLRSVQIICIQVRCLETQIFANIELNCSGFRKLLAREWKGVVLEDIKLSLESIMRNTN